MLPASASGRPTLLDPLAASVVTVLVQDEPRDAPLVPDKGDLCVHGFQEELRLRLGKDRNLRLAGGLDEERVAVSRHGNRERRGQSVFADAGLESFCGDVALLALLRRLRERKARLDEVQADVVDVRGRSGENDRAPLDEVASKQSHRVNAALAQYTPAQGDARANFEKIQKLLDATVEKPNLLVAPAYSLTGVPADAAAGSVRLVYCRQQTAGLPLRPQQ